jgi:hypothetical protein
MEVTREMHTQMPVMPVMAALLNASPSLTPPLTKRTGKRNIKKMKN